MRRLFYCTQHQHRAEWRAQVLRSLHVCLTPQMSSKSQSLCVLKCNPQTRGLVGLIIIHRNMNAEGSRLYKKCRCELITCFFLPPCLSFVSHHLWHGRAQRCQLRPKEERWVRDMNTLLLLPHGLWNKVFHLNDKQNDLETLEGSLAPAPPCLHAKLSIMQNKGRRSSVSRELICVSRRHVGQLWVSRSNSTLLMLCSVVFAVLLSERGYFHLQSSSQKDPVFFRLAYRCVTEGQGQQKHGGPRRVQGDK